MQASPRVDVDEAPGADLLHATELVDIHDLIKLLNSDDNLGFFMESLLISKSDAASGKRERSCSHVTCSAQSITGLNTCQFEIDILQCENWKFLGLYERVDLSALIQNQNCCLTPKCELWWKLNVKPLF